MHNKYTWEEAFTLHVATLNTMRFAGRDDWRLPNLNELESLRRLDALPAAWPAFTDNCGTLDQGNPGCTVLTCSCTYPGPTWTSSTSAFKSSEAWLVEGYAGDAFWFDKQAQVYVRAVRGGL